MSLFNLFCEVFWLCLYCDCVNWQIDRSDHVWNCFSLEVRWLMHINLWCDRTRVYHSLPSDSLFTPSAHQCEISQWLITSLLSPCLPCSSLSPKNSFKASSSFFTELFEPSSWKAAVTSALDFLAKSEKASHPYWPLQLPFPLSSTVNYSSSFCWLSILFLYLHYVCVTSHSTQRNVCVSLGGGLGALATHKMSLLLCHLEDWSFSLQ